ncbi:MAG TPA: CcmD family protein [Vicinamibacterales bacterium]
MKRNLLAALLLLTLAAPAFAQAQPPPKPAAQDEFVPVNAPINPQDTIPAQRLVGIAYGFIWVVLLGYVWSVRSRLTRVEQEIEAVSRRLPERK